MKYIIPIIVIFIILVIYFIFKIMSVPKKSMFKLPCLLIGMHLSECNKLIKRVGINDELHLKDNKGYFQFNEKRLVNYITLRFDDETCVHVKWIVKGLTANNLDFITKETDIFSEVWEKVEKDDYIECYKSKINKNGIKECNNIIRYYGLNKDKLIMLEAYAAGWGLDGGLYQNSEHR